MHNLLVPTVILLLFITIRAGDIAITSTYARETIRAILYSVIALLALIALILSVV